VGDRGGAGQPGPAAPGRPGRRPPLVQAGLPRRPSRARLEAPAAPTLVVLAERSKAHSIRRVAAGARERVLAVRIEVLPGTTHHSIPTEHADALSRLLLSFLQEQL
jgi:hypothetical protein